MMKLCLAIHVELLPRFYKLLQQGFVVNAKSGSSVKDLLCEQMGVGEDYLQDRIQTLFLNGMSVDDAAKAVIPNNATLALSGAMPGLVGATLRKGGALAAMRNTISYRETQTSREYRTARVKIKLFNLILIELGPIFLESGVLLDHDQLKEFLARNWSDLKAGCPSVDLGGRYISVTELKGVEWKGSEVFLKVRSE